jgi:hypothetical protein
VVAVSLKKIALHYAVRAVRAFMPSIELEDPTAEKLL